MRRLRRILIISSILSRFIIGFVVADDSDCGIFWVLEYNHSDSENGFVIVNQSWETENNKYSNFLTLEQQKGIITKNDINTALLNLKKYCCEKNLWGLKNGENTCLNDQDFFNPNTLDSQYLFDHIFDVMMRRLVWLTGDTDIYVKTNMTVDNLWQERRQLISSKAENLSWSNTQSIVDAYKKYWKSNYDITQEINWTFSLDDQSFLSYVGWWAESQESEQVSEVIKNYEKWTLYDRYWNVCALTRYFYALFNLWRENVDRNTIINRLSSGTCESFVTLQIDREANYTQLVAQRSSNQFLSNYIEGYLWYFYDRGNKLKTLWKNATDRWLDVVRAVPHLVKQSVK